MAHEQDERARADSALADRMSRILTAEARISCAELGIAAEAAARVAMVAGLEERFARLEARVFRPGPLARLLRLFRRGRR